MDTWVESESSELPVPLTHPLMVVSHCSGVAKGEFVEETDMGLWIVWKV